MDHFLFILEERQIIQKLCKNVFEWEERTPEEPKYAWTKWLHSLQELEELKVPWCYKPNQFGGIADYNLHHFSDTSEVGYEQAGYLSWPYTLHYPDGKGSCSTTEVDFNAKNGTYSILSFKVVSLQRKLVDYLQKSIKETYWTDSWVVLKYIQNGSKYLWPIGYWWLVIIQTYLSGGMWTHHKIQQILHEEV